jgi:hypothetical protein
LDTCLQVSNGFDDDNDFEKTVSENENIGLRRILGNYRQKNIRLTANVNFEQKEQERAISKLKRKENELKILRMKISKFTCQKRCKC